jgi:hypothetical protein
VLLLATGPPSSRGELSRNGSRMRSGSAQLLVFEGMARPFAGYRGASSLHRRGQCPGVACGRARRSLEDVAHHRLPKLSASKRPPGTTPRNS